MPFDDDQHNLGTTQGQATSTSPAFPAPPPTPKPPPPPDRAGFAKQDAEQALAGPGVQVTVVENILHDALVKTYEHGRDGREIRAGAPPHPAALARTIRMGLGRDPARELEVLAVKLDRLTQ